MYFPNRMQGKGSSSRSRARCRVFSRIQVIGTASRSESCCGVSNTGDASPDCESTARAGDMLGCCAGLCFASISIPVLPCKVCATAIPSLTFRIACKRRSVRETTVHSHTNDSPAGSQEHIAFSGKCLELDY